MKALEEPPLRSAINTDRYSLHLITEGKINTVTSRRRPVLLITLAVVVIAAAVITAIATTRGSTQRHAATTPWTVAPTAAASPSAAGSVSPSPVLTPLITAPVGVTWSLLEGIGLPASTTDGPTRIAGPIYAGYTHTPTGALLAAVNIQYRALLTPNRGWAQVISQQILPSPQRTKLANARAQASDGPDPDLAQVAGFRFVTYATDTAVIDLATRASDGTLQDADITVRWASGDWKMDLPASAPPAAQIASLDGFVTWQGVA